MLNNYKAIGRLTKTPELRTLESGTSIARTSIAVDDSYKNKQGEWVDRAYFVNLTGWGKTAEYMANYFVKGERVCIDSKLTTNKYTNKDGVEITGTEMIVNSMRRLDKRSEAQNEAQTASSSNPAPDQVPDHRDGLPF